MAHPAGYLVDLSTYKFDDTESTQTWIQAMPLGDYDHPQYGTISVTPDRVQHFADSVKNKVRDQELDIDYDHKAYGGEAAGWVKDAEARGDGLWLLVDWTKKAYGLLKEKAYKYFSPEFDDEWTHPKTGVKHTDVIFGGGITNRPFLKDILPINMSEMFSSVPPKPNEGGSKVTPEQIKAAAEKLGLEPTASEDDIFKALDELTIVDAPMDAIVDSGTGDPGALPIAASEAVRKLAEENPAIKFLMDQNAALQKQFGETQGALQLAEANTAVTKLADRAKAKNVALPPTLMDSMRTTLVGLSGQKQLSENIIKGFEDMIDAKVVQLGEIGKGRGKFQVIDGGNESLTASEEFVAGTKKLMGTDPKLDYIAAAKKFADENPEAYHAYRNEVGRGLAGGEG